jgi:uncharacterized membrane protein
MTLLIVGLTLFIGIHLMPIVTPLRERLVASLSPPRYRALFAAIAGLGLILVIVGYHLRPERVQLFSPSTGARTVAPLVVSIAFVLFAIANMPTHTRRVLRHPMLIGLMLWSGVHLLANGDLAGTVLFGSFFAYSVVALASAIGRGAVKAFAPAWKFDVMGLAGGLLGAYLVMHFHPLLFGTAPVA